MDPHAKQPVLQAGRPLATAKAALILVHGRNAPAESMIDFAAEFTQPDFALLAPQAAGFTWYPYSFLAPMPQNEPGISSGLAKIGAVVAMAEAVGLPTERLILLGFSQGACLTLEYAARHPARYGGVVALSGGLIGPPGTPRQYPGTLNNTPVFLGCSDVDAHIPKERVEESATVLAQMGAQVTKRIYPGMGHTVNEDELAFVRALVAQVGR